MKFLKISFLTLTLILAGSTAIQAQRSYGAQTKKSQKAMTPQMAYQRLKDGNSRYVKNKLKANKKYRKQAPFTAKGQYPYATILSCIDSRVAAEEIFDLGNGDAFTGRVAGNVVTPDMLGSFEFATKLAGSKVLVVLGHTNCGAVKGACDNVKLGRLTGLLKRIQPAVDFVKKSWADGETNSKNPAYVQAVSDANVKLALKEIRKESKVIDDLVKSGDLLLLGGMYNLSTGKVSYVSEG